MKVSFNDLIKIERFEHIEKETLLKVIDEFKRATFKTGDPLFTEHSVFTNCFIVIEGYAKIFKTNQDGTAGFISVMGPESFLGEFAFLNEGKYPMTAVAASKMKVLLLSSRGYDFLWHHSSHFSFEFSKRLFSNFSLLKSRVADLAVGDAMTRLIHFYTFLGKTHGLKCKETSDLLIPFLLSRQDVSDAVNLKCETVSRLTTELTKKKMILRNSEGVLLKRKFTEVYL